MPFNPDNDRVKWLVGKEVEATKTLLRQTDAAFLLDILRKSLGPEGSLNDLARHAQRICDEALATVERRALDNPISSGGVPIWSWYNPAAQNDYSISVRILASLKLLHNNELINPLAFGDFCRAFADMLSDVPQGANAGLNDIALFAKSLQNKEAFSKTTNRVRVKRRDILNQMPGVGGTHWYLPSNDVLGAMDRLLGYYETADISGSTTDSLAAMGVVRSVQDSKVGSLEQVKKQVAMLVNRGLGFVSFAAMAIQMHHSLPECMMAINLMPRDFGLDEPFRIYQVYSPFLTNHNFAGLNELDNIYLKWQQARFTALHGDGDRDARLGRMLLVFQDIFQMPNRAADVNEVGAIVPFKYTPEESTNDPTCFGLDFYNAVVAEMNESNPGPAITLEKLSVHATNLWFQDSVFNPSIPEDQSEPVRRCIEKGMVVPSEEVEHVDNFAGLVSPFLLGGLYGRIEPATIHNLR